MSFNVSTRAKILVVALRSGHLRDEHRLDPRFCLNGVMPELPHYRHISGFSWELKAPVRPASRVVVSTPPLNYHGS